MKVIFLDFDGVLNSRAWIQSTRAKASSAIEQNLGMFDPAAVERLNFITDETKAKIVLSTSWRLMFSLSDLIVLLQKVGTTGEVVGATPANLDWCAETYGTVQERWEEIQTYLDESKDIEDFIILEDYEDMSHFGDRAIMTNHKVGLIDSEVERAISILGGSAHE